MMRQAAACAAQTRRVAGGVAPRRSRCRSTSPMPVMVQATLSGAITGPTHGTGMRNRTSQVSSDAGQSSTTLSHT